MIAVIDIETGGFGKETPIVQLGAIIIKNGSVVKEINMLVEPYKEEEKYTEKAQEIHGYSLGDLRVRGYNINVVQSVISEALKGVETLLGHNIKKFDLPILKNVFECFNGGFEVLDTKEIAAENGFEKGERSLSYLCDYYGISSIDFHDALEDCYGCYNIYKQMT